MSIRCVKILVLPSYNYVSVRMKGSLEMCIFVHSKDFLRGLKKKEKEIPQNSKNQNQTMVFAALEIFHLNLCFYKLPYLWFCFIQDMNSRLLDFKPGSSFFKY